MDGITWFLDSFPKLAAILVPNFCWTEYQLAERSGLPQSTISSWYRKNMVPTIPSLEKICAAFGITLSQLFAEGDAPVSLTESQRKLLERWSKLSADQQAVVFALIDKM